MRQAEAISESTAVSELIRSLLVRAARCRQFARSFPDKRTRLGLRVLAAKLEERARQIERRRTPESDGGMER
jgi:hypothetical protein